MPYQLTFVASRRTEHDVAPTKRLNALYEMVLELESGALTGLFVESGARRLYCMEGEEDAVAAHYDGIKADPSVESVVILRQRTVADRSFRRWSFAFDHDPREDQPLTLEDRVVALLFGVPGEIRRTFLAFSRFEDKAQRH